MKNIYLLLCSIVFMNGLQAQFDENNTSFKKNSGLFNYYHDQQTDKVYLEVTELDKPFLYVNSLSSGIGSNDIGLDRGQLGEERLVFFKKAGTKILLVQPNLKYRAISNNALERKSVEQAFAKSILYGFPIEKEIAGKYIIDISDFLMQDTKGVAKVLKQKKQGTFKLDKSKSALNLERTKAFPKNVEFDVYLTFNGDAKGEYIKSVTPNADIVTVAQHHSFIELPPAGYKERVFDPRCGSYPFSYYDYATPIDEPILKRFVTRHRLEKKDPTAAISEAVEPIVYYLDNGTPEPVRSALLEGGKWWNEAFESIGFKNAFQLKMLPDEADPLDVRYNVIQWVHRSTRGWSYGASITDPRTGEIIKGHVSLGSLRIRQDFLIAQALSDKPYQDKDADDSKMLELALARIRQLSAHEIGHTLGFTHNFAASTNNRASVMDYPHPKLVVKNGKIDFSNAYDTGIGDWDKVTVAYNYAIIPSEEEEVAYLNRILENATKKGLRFIGDADARAAGGAHAFGHLWDNGDKAYTELQDILEVREVGIKQFSIDNIKKNDPNTLLEDVFVPLYFLHRYQTEAATKLIGGLDYNYTVKGDGQKVVEYLPKEEQELALKQVLRTLDANILGIPEEKLLLFPPRAIGYSSTRESFKGRIGVGFDALAAAETAADMTLFFLLHPQRASRLVQQKSLDSGQLGLQEVLDQVVLNTINKSSKGTYLREIQQTINFRVLYHIMNLSVSPDVHPQVNGIAFNALDTIKRTIASKDDAISKEMLRRINQFNKEPKEFKVIEAQKIPDGSPIGMDCPIVFKP
ncbi:zinc-dependent metalloprotease [Eudoraea chungangensis]|uniref:zinc-dependent metalloprotease n=1 Tax=Eudoraea chungangensis TaxID=1481905 RepID=UPI0023EDE5D2|nr:zinc-dependent metalloprotease [Eudoraea chungangensis]